MENVACVFGAEGEVMTEAAKPPGEDGVLGTDALRAAARCSTEDVGGAVNPNAYTDPVAPTGSLRDEPLCKDCAFCRRSWFPMFWAPYEFATCARFDSPCSGGRRLVTGVGNSFASIARKYDCLGKFWVSKHAPTELRRAPNTIPPTPTDID